ncbi:MAG TPA: TolC family protein [Longimicrobiales bacterium]
MSRLLRARRTAALACATILTTAPMGAIAQTRPPAVQIPARLTLEEALRLARTYNPGYQQYMNDVEVAEAGVRSAWGAFMPRLSTGMGISGGQSTTETYVDPTGKPQRLDDPQISKGSSLSQSIGASFTLFDGGRMWRNLSAQRASVRMTEASISIQASDLDAAVRQAFYQSLRAGQSITLSERLLASAQERLRQTEALFRAASKGQVDVLGAQVDVAQSEMALEAAKDGATKARLELARAIGVQSDGMYEVVGDLPAVFDPATLDVNALVSTALTSNPAVLRQEQSAIVADRQAAAAKGSRWPSLGGNFGYSRSVNVPDYSAYRYLNPQNSGISLSLNASLPLFTGFSTSAQITQARAAAHDARLQLQQTRLQTEANVRSAFIDLQNAFSSLRLADRQASLSEQRLALSQEQYRMGSITFSELQLMIDRAATAQRDALNARFNWITNWINLEQRVGAPVIG